MFCPFKNQEIKDLLTGKHNEQQGCPARVCPFLKNGIEKWVENRGTEDVSDSEKIKCPFLRQHNCSFLKKLSCSTECCV